MKDALYICAQTNLIVHIEDGNAILVASMFETVGLQTREDWDKQGTKTKALVGFNSLDSGIQNNLIAAKIIVIPHPFFANEAKNTNVQHGRIEQRLDVSPPNHSLK